MHLFDKKNLLAILLILIISGGISCGKKNNSDKAKGQKGPKTLNVEAYVVKTQSYKKTYSASGSLLPNEQIEIHPEISGRVTAILFKEGTHVHKGQTLIQLYDADILAQIQKLKAQKALQVKTLQRQDELLRIGGISKQDYETTQTTIASSDADIAYSEALLRRTKIVAPFNGVVGIRDISVGAIVSPTTVVANLQQIATLKMDFSIPDQYRQLLNVNNAVQFTIENHKDTLTGKISAIDPGADATTRTVKVRAIVSNTDKKLIPGSFAHVIINFETDTNAILIPSQAVIPTTKDKQVAVIKNAKVVLQTIKIEDRTEDKVQISQGLLPGDTVITSGIMQVKTGMQVGVTKLVQ